MTMKTPDKIAARKLQKQFQGLSYTTALRFIERARVEQNMIGPGFSAEALAAAAAKYVDTSRLTQESK